MWLLMRAPVPDDRPRELASCPDTTSGSGVVAEAWQWSMHLDHDGRVRVTTEPSLALAVTQVHDRPVTVERPAGTIVGLVPTTGVWTVEVVGGPWRRAMHPGDLLLVEDDRGEMLRISPTDGTGTAIQVTLSPVDLTAPLRWIP